MTAVSSNMKYSAALGWSPSDFGAHAFDSALVNAITAKQAELGIAADGVCGPKTYAALLAAWIKPLVGTEDLEQAGKLAMLCAKGMWLQNIVDLPPTNNPDYERCRTTIDALIRSIAGVNWSWLEPYPENTAEWCLMFVARQWGIAGVPLQARKYFFPSTLRIDQWARYKPWESTPNPRPAEGPYRMIINLNENSKPNEARFPDGTLPRAGDIVLVGGVNTGPGKHGTIAESYDPVSGVFTTIEGNATGLLPNGSRAHGVIRATRRVGLSANQAPATYHVRRVIRPAPADIGSHS